MNPRFRLTSERIELSEDDVEAQCLQVLRLRGYRVERLHAGRFRSMDGRRVITGAPKGTRTTLPAMAGIALSISRRSGRVAN